MSEGTAEGDRDPLEAHDLPPAELPPDTLPIRGSTLRLLVSRPFGPYVLGSALSSIGTWFQNIAAGLLVYELTGSTLLVGTVNFALFIGTVLLAPWAGSAADRYDRRRLLMLTQLVAALVSVALAVATVLGLVSAAVVVAASLLLGLSLAFMVPALQALVPLLVAEEDLDLAISLNSVSFNLARAVGPVLGAMVAQGAGYGTAFTLNAASFVVFAVALAFVRPRRQHRVKGPPPKLLETARLVVGSRNWTALLVATCVISISTDPINTLTPELALDVFGGRRIDAGLLVGAFGAGATFTAFTLTSWVRRRRHALFGGMLIQGFGMIGVGLAPSLPVALAFLAASGAGFIAGITRATVRLQLEVPDAQRGRVMALWSLAFVGTRPFAALVSGVVAEAFDARVAAVVMALPVLLAVPWLHRRLQVGRPQVCDDGTSDAS